MSAGATNYRANLRDRSRGALGEQQAREATQRLATAPMPTANPRWEMWTSDITDPEVDMVYGLRAGGGGQLPQWEAVGAYDPLYILYGLALETHDGKARLLIEGAITRHPDSGGDGWTGIGWASPASASYDPRLSLRTILRVVTFNTRVIFFRGASALTAAGVDLDRIALDGWPFGTAVPGAVIARNGRRANAADEPYGIILSTTATSATVCVSGPVPSLADYATEARYLDPAIPGATLAESATAPGTAQRLWRIGGSGRIEIRRMPGDIEMIPGDFPAGKVLSALGELASPYRIETAPYGVSLGPIDGLEIGTYTAIQRGGPTALAGWEQDHLWLAGADGDSEAAALGSMSDGNPARTWRLGGRGRIAIQHQRRVWTWAFTLTSESEASLAGPLAPGWPAATNAMELEIEIQGISGSRTAGQIDAGDQIWWLRAQAVIVAGAGSGNLTLQELTLPTTTQATEIASGHAHDYAARTAGTQSLAGGVTTATTATGWNASFAVPTIGSKVSLTLNYLAATGALTAQATIGYTIKTFALRVTIRQKWVS